MTRTSRQLAPTVRHRLGRLRWLLRARLMLEGLAWLAGVGVVCVVVSLLLDYLLRLDATQRAILLGLASLVMLATLYRALLRPLRIALDAQTLALLIERHFRNLGDVLISAMQLSAATTHPPGTSQAMIDRVVDQANAQAANLPVGELIETRRLGRIWLIAGALLVLLGTFTAARPDVMTLWLQRSVLLRNIDWPQRTYLSIYQRRPDGMLHPLLVSTPAGELSDIHRTVPVLRGGQLELVAVNRGHVAPAEVTLHASYPSLGRTEEPLASAEPALAENVQTALGLDDPAAVYTIAVEHVTEPLTFHLTGGDDRRDARTPHTVSLIDAPALRDVRLTIALPAYHQSQDRPVRDGARGVLPVPVGSVVHIQARATKDLTSARLLLAGESAGQIALTRDASETGPRSLRGSFPVGGPNKPRTIPLAIALQDTAGYTNHARQQMLIQVIPDRAPAVTLEPLGVSEVVAPTARIPLNSRATDDHGLAELQLTWTAQPPGDDPATQPASTPRPAGPAVKPQAATRRLDDKPILDIEPLKLSVGTDIRIEARTRDLLPADLGGPNETASPPVHLRVISREDLLARMVSKQKEVRTEFFQATGQQELVRGMAASAAERTGPARQKELTAAAKRQSAVQSEIRKAADTLEAVALEMDLNRLAKPEENQAILTDIVQPIRQIDRQMTRVVEELTAASEGAARPLENARADLDDIARQLDALLKKMRKLENRLELAQRLEGLLKMAVEVDALLDKRVEKSTENIFDSPTGEKED